MEIFFRNVVKQLKLTFVLIMICGILYPLVMFAFSQVLFPHQANGSLIERNGVVVGSKIVGQALSGDIYMQSRPSAVNYNTYAEADKANGTYTGIASGSYNYSVENPLLHDRVKNDSLKFLEKNPSIKREDIPADLLQASGSGLDPHISVLSAEIQIDRIAKASGLERDTIEQIVKNNTEGKILGIFGEDKVNVLLVNLAIADKLGIAR